jgi:hypothetical protein
LLSNLWTEGMAVEDGPRLEECAAMVERVVVAGARDGCLRFLGR